IRQLFSVIRPFCTILSAILFWIFSTEKPGVVLFSTMNAFTWLSATSRAQITDTSHHGELPIHFFWPFRIQVLPSRFAVVVSPPDAPEPGRGSVRRNHPFFCGRPRGESFFCFSPSAPPKWMVPIARLL